jgi:hypothetical protein
VKWLFEGWNWPISERYGLFSSVMIETTMDHSVVFPIYARLDDGQVIRIESFQKILYRVEAVDIENDEYQFWDANGRSLKILIEKNAVSRFQNANNRLSFQQAAEMYTEQLGVPIDTSGTPDEVWAKVQKAEQSVPQRRGFLARLFGR